LVLIGKQRTTASLTSSGAGAAGVRSLWLFAIPHHPALPE
jgi:hypothetical protein